MLLLKYLWPFGGVGKVISGHVYRYGTTTRLVIKLESGSEIKAWEVTRDNFKIECMGELIRELAYKVSLYLAPEDTLKTWKGFKFLTEAISKYDEYHRRKFAMNSTPNPDKYQQQTIYDCLHKAFNYCLLAVEVDGKGKKISHFLYYFGVFLFKEKKYLESEKLLNLAIQINPSDKYFHNALGNVFFRLRRYDAAIDQYHLTQEIDPNFPYLYNGLGNVYSTLGGDKTENALEQYTTAIDKQVNFWKPSHNRGNIYLYSEKYKDLDKAKIEYEKSKEKSKGKVSAPYSGLGLVYLFMAQQNDNPEACTDLLENAKLEMLKAIDRDNTSSACFWNLGLIQLWLGQLLEVHSSWEKALQIVINNKNEELCIAVYGFAVKAIPFKGRPRNDLNPNLENIESILKRPEYFSKKGRLEMFLKDLELIENSRHKLLDIDKLIKLFEDAI